MRRDDGGAADIGKCRTESHTHTTTSQERNECGIPNRRNRPETNSTHCFSVENQITRIRWNATQGWEGYKKKVILNNDTIVVQQPKERNLSYDAIDKIYILVYIYNIFKTKHVSDDSDKFFILVFGQNVCIENEKVSESDILEKVIYIGV